jgi:hypothetical protein
MQIALPPPADKIGLDPGILPFANFNGCSNGEEMSAVTALSYW